MKKVVIYPGRFQPMLSHHVKVYRSIQEQFPGADVYIGTSDKVEPGKSPFNFQEKRLIAKAHGIDPSKVLLAPRPYHNMDYEANFEEMSDNFDPTKVQIFFAVGEKDVRERFPMNNVDEETGLDMKVRGEPGPKYYQMINTYKQDPQPMSVRGYIAPIDNVIDDMEEVQSASAFREALKNAPDVESAKQIFEKEFGEMNNQVFDLVYKKIAGEKMTEELNILRRLAGMDVQEAAPVEFESELNPGKVKFMDADKSSAKMSIANRFPEGKDPNDKDDKKEVFVQALLKSPASLLSEINERIDPKDENSLMVSDKLSKVIDNLTDRYSEPNIMSLEDEDKKFIFKVVNTAIEDMDLVAGDDSEPEYQPEPEQDDLDNITNPMDRNESVDLGDIRSEYGVEEGKVKDMAMDQAEEFYDKVSQHVDNLNDVEEAILRAWDDSEDNPPEWALDDETRAILQSAGKIEPEQEEPEMEEPEMESKDARMEPSRDEEAMNHVMDGNFGEAAFVLGDTSKNAGDNLMDEWSEYCSLRGLDRKDALNDTDHVESFIDEVVGSMDDKNYPPEMESLEELRKLAGLEEMYPNDRESRDQGVNFRKVDFGGTVQKLTKEFGGELPDDTIRDICQKEFDKLKDKPMGASGEKEIGQMELYNNCRDKLKSVIPA